MKFNSQGNSIAKPNDPPLEKMFKKPYHRIYLYACNAFPGAKPRLKHILTFHNQSPSGFMEKPKS